MLVAHSTDDAEVFEAITRITHNQVVHVYFNGTFEAYQQWMDAEVEVGKVEG
jgi:hypothetical protein